MDKQAWWNYIAADDLFKVENKPLCSYSQPQRQQNILWLAKNLLHAGGPVMVRSTYKVNGFSSERTQ